MTFNEKLNIYLLFIHVVMTTYGITSYNLIIIIN